jgi:hypothetical protein
MFHPRAKYVSRIAEASIGSRTSNHLMAERLSGVVYSDMVLSESRPESLDTFNGNIECGAFDQQ